MVDIYHNILINGPQHQFNPVFGNMTIRQLRDLWLTTNDSSILEYVRVHRGFSDLVAITPEIAMGLIGAMLEFEDSSNILNEIRFSDKSDLAAIFDMIVGVFCNIYEGTDVKLDTIYEIMSKLDMRHPNIYYSDLNRKFIMDLFMSVKSNSIRMPNYSMSPMIDSILHNPSIAMDDIFGWLGDLEPNIPLSYVGMYKSLMCEDSINSSGKPLYLSFYNILDILTKYIEYMENYNSRQLLNGPQDIDNNLAIATMNIVNELIEYEDDRMVRSDSLCKLFHESCMSIILLKQNHYEKIFKFFWSSWLITNYSMIVYNKLDMIAELSKSEYDVDEIMSQLYDLFEESRRYALGSNDLLVYSLYYTEIYDTYRDLIYAYDISLHDDILSFYQDDARRAIDNGLIDANWLTDPIIYLENLSIEYPNVKIFSKYSTNAERRESVSINGIDDILDALQ